MAASEADKLQPADKDYTQLKKSIANQTPDDGGNSPINTRSLSHAFEQEEWRSQEARRASQIHNNGLNEYYALRVRWSHCLKFLLIVLVMFQCFLVAAVGRNWMDFTKYQSFLKIQATVYFLQVVGMCLIVVRYLFKDPQEIKSNTEIKPNPIVPESSGNN